MISNSAQGMAKFILICDPVKMALPSDGCRIGPPIHVSPSRYGLHHKVRDDGLVTFSCPAEGTANSSGYAFRSGLSGFKVQEFRDHQKFLGNVLFPCSSVKTRWWCALPGFSFYVRRRDSLVTFSAWKNPRLSKICQPKKGLILIIPAIMIHQINSYIYQKKISLATSTRASFGCGCWKSKK